MDIKNIQLFIDETTYDFQTIEYLLEYGRIKETVPIIKQILESIQLFRNQLKAGPYEGLFSESFWDKIFRDKLSMGDLRARITELAKTKGPMMEKNLEVIGYQQFVEEVRSWVYKNIHQLNQTVKPPLHSKMKVVLVVLSMLLVGGGLVSTFVVKSKPLNGGLNTNYYEDLRFTPQDVEEGKGWIQKLGPHPNWPIQNHLLANNSEGLLSVVKYFSVPQQGRYLVTIFHDSAPDFIDAMVQISSIVPLQVHMQTWSSSLIYSQDSYVCVLPAGKNSVRIFGQGNRKRRFLGLNSVAVRPL